MRTETKEVFRMYMMLPRLRRLLEVLIKQCPYDHWKREERERRNGGDGRPGHRSVDDLHAF